MQGSITPVSLEDQCHNSKHLTLSPSSPSWAWCHMVWNIPLISWGQLCQLWSLPTSCTPSACCLLVGWCEEQKRPWLFKCCSLVSKISLGYQRRLGHRLEHSIICCVMRIINSILVKTSAPMRGNPIFNLTTDANCFEICWIISDITIVWKKCCLKHWGKTLLLMKVAKNTYVATWPGNLWFVSWQGIKLQMARKRKYPLTEKKTHTSQCLASCTRESLFRCVEKKTKMEKFFHY